MASAPTLPLVPVDEYVNTSYEPDVEYVDGVLVERGIPTIAHNLLGRILLFWFAQYERSLRFMTLYETRTQIVARARYRIPDVLLVPTPLPGRGICDVAPWTVIEIESPGDTIAKTRARFFDYTRIGVRHLILMDPEELVAFRFDHGSIIETEFHSLELPTGEAPFDSKEIFRRLREDLDAS